MRVTIEDAKRSCPICALLLKYLTFDRSHDDLPPVTLSSCPNCGHLGGQAENGMKQPAG